MIPRDILVDLGPLALGSRLKRLSERLLADAARMHREDSGTAPPGQFPLVAALDRYGPMSVNDAAAALGISQPAATRAAAEAAKSGLVESVATAADRRFRTLSLTAHGRAWVADLKRSNWPRVEAAARELTEGFTDDLLSHLAALEARMDEQSLRERYDRIALRIVPYRDDLAPTFFEINREWIEAMYSMEPHDRELLENPSESIIRRGGHVLFVEDGEGTILGTCALEAHDDGFTELSKMGVRAEARGKGAGEFLLRAALERARELGLRDRLFLLSNRKSEAAIHLYEKVGFVHDAEILARFGPRYARADVAMRFVEGAR
ncbi:MAG: helix-turn-helix domain-containing GNAT family N-acetyltransferase [Planctomycetota bacterium]